MLARFCLSKPARLNCEALEDRSTPALIGTAVESPGEASDHQIEYHLSPPFVDTTEEPPRTTDAPVPCAPDLLLPNPPPTPSEAPTCVIASEGNVGVFNADGTLLFTFIPFEGFNGPVTVVSSLWNYDNPLIAVTANGHVKLFNGRTGTEIRSFFAYSGLDGPITVASGYVDDDGVSDIITGAGPNGHVKAFDWRTGAEIRSFFAYSGLDGPMAVVAMDINSDGVSDIITGAGPNGHVKAYDARTGAEIRSFFAHPGSNAEPTITNIDVHAYDRMDILIGTVGGPVKIFSGRDLSLLHSLDPHDIFGEGIGT